MRHQTSRARARILPRPDLVQALGALAAVIASGAAIAAVLPEPSPWQQAAAFLAPAGLAFLIHWWNAEKP